MDFNPNRYSRLERVKPKQSSIEYKTSQLRGKLGDPTLGEGTVALALKYLSESQIDSIADYVLRKANNPGRAFVKICSNKVKEVSGGTASHLS